MLSQPRPALLVGMSVVWENQLDAADQLLQVVYLGMSAAESVEVGAAEMRRILGEAYPLHG